MDEAPFYIERAKGGRASCKDCKASCPSGELRIAKLAIGPYGEGRPMKLWYHVNCLMKVLLKQRPTTKRIQSTEDIGNFSNLSAEDKETFLQTLNEMEKDFANKNNLELKVITETAPKDDVEDVAPSKNTTVEYDVNHKDNKFKTFCDLCINIAKNDKHLDKTAIVKKFFTEGTDRTGFKSDIGLWCRFLLPGVIKRIYNLKNKQLVKLFSKILKTSHDDMLTDLEQGNIGETLKKFYEQSSIYRNVPSTLSVFEIDEFLNHLSSLTKEDEQTYHFNQIINRCSADDLKYLTYLINGDLRMNAGAKNILGGVHNDAYKIFQSSRDIKVVISRVMSSDKDKTSPVKNQVNADIIIMKPVLPMLAEACKSVAMAMEKCKNGMLSEIKYDGERVQVHKSGSEFRYYSRSLKPVLGHKIARFKDFIPQAFPHADDLILDSEILMIDTKDGKPLPFGTLGVHKKGEFKDAEVCLFVFDCIYYNGKSLVKEPMRKRRKILEKNMIEVKNHVVLSEMQIINEESDLADMIIKVLKLGLEGLVLKDLESTYEPGKRHWLKVKKDYLFEGAMADCADLVVLGASFGTGKNGSLLSVFLMGCYDDVKDHWLTVTKVHTGFDDSTLASLQNMLKSKMTKISGDYTKVPSWLSCTKTVVPDFIAIDPKKQPVWEIMGTEFTKAKIHTADGISIRFPRVNRIRDDKCWSTATSLNELKNLFETSKSHMDMSLFDKYKKKDTDQASGKILKLSSDESDTDTKLSKNIPDTDLSEAGPSETHKRKPENDFFKPKKMRIADKSAPKNPLPDVFTDCILKFYPDDAESDPEVKDIMRYWKAYNGFEDMTEDGSEATHVVHFKNSFKLKKLKKTNYNFSKKARHVTIDWVKESIMNKKLMDTRPFAVVLK